MIVTQTKRDRPDFFKEAVDAQLEFTAKCCGAKFYFLDDDFEHITFGKDSLDHNFIITCPHCRSLVEDHVTGVFPLSVREKENVRRKQRIYHVAIATFLIGVILLSFSFTL